MGGPQLIISTSMYIEGKKNHGLTSKQASGLFTIFPTVCLVTEIALQQRQAVRKQYFSPQRRPSCSRITNYCQHGQQTEQKNETANIDSQLKRLMFQKNISIHQRRQFTLQHYFWSILLYESETWRLLGNWTFAT